MLASDYLEEIAWSFRKQRLRTALTSVGIAIGAFAITVMVGLGQGVESYIEEQILNFGDPRVIMVFPDTVRAAEQVFDKIARIGKPARRIEEDDEAERRLRRGGRWITPEQVAELREVPGVEQVAPLTWIEVDGVALADGLASNGGGPEGATPTAGWFEADFAALATHPLVGAPLAGRVPAPDEEEAVVVLSPQYAQAFRLDPTELVGRGVAIRVPKLANVLQRFVFRDPTRYREEHRIFVARIVGLAERSLASRSIYASIELGREMARYQSGNPEIFSDQKIGFQVHVRVARDADLPKVKAEIKKLGLLAKSVDDQVAEVTRGFLVVKLALSAFGLIAVLVATLGITNTLLMAISERTREIGVMKALGATESTIRRMFAAEAAAIGVAGGALGTLAAVLLGALLNVVAHRYFDAEAFGSFSAFVFPAWLLLGAIGFSGLVGGLAGIYPANRAARLDPIEALRYE